MLLGVQLIAVFFRAFLDRVRSNGCMALRHKKVGLLWCIMVIRQCCGVSVR
jgi:hypothetical protein